MLKKSFKRKIFLITLTVYLLLTENLISAKTDTAITDTPYFAHFNDTNVSVEIDTTDPTYVNIWKQAIAA